MRSFGERADSANREHRDVDQHSGQHGWDTHLHGELARFGRKRQPCEFSYIYGWENDSDCYLGHTSADHLRHSAEFNSAQCHGKRPGDFRLLPAAGQFCPSEPNFVGDFTPTDSATYSTVTKTVSLVVNKATTTTTITSVSPNPVCE